MSGFVDIWDGVYADILAMGLAGVTSDNLKQQQFPYNPKTLALSEGIFICPEDEILVPNAGSNERSEIAHGVSVTMIAASNKVLGRSPMSIILGWRNLIRLRYHNKLPINVATVHRFYCEQGRTVMPAAFLKNFDASALTIRAVAYEG